MTELFGRDQSVISRHIRNAMKEGEVSEESNMQKLHIANSDRPVTFYDRREEAVINDSGLAALTLLVAESDPRQKETMIRLIMNILTPQKRGLTPFSS